MTHSRQAKKTTSPRHHAARGGEAIQFFLSLTAMGHFDPTNLAVFISNYVDRELK
ncbi:hypothetical protein [Legionella pneumophila]|uniref:hypothetical protein n=1 Tax=Legionella pneumophila TaxID=446 RepID=UPI0022B3FCC6|nr:hypothetical protein [Legionella pneumophila]MCZ4765925.1 hypothetical protein [Legionella pneumophila]